jgi:phosphoribosylamine--glycine ligase
MNVLVIGSGGREHAVIKALTESRRTPKIYCAPGNAGIAEQASLLKFDIKNHAEAIRVCKEHKIDFVFIGPEDPLVDGLSDSLRENNIPVFGPSKAAAQLEGSKIFAKEFMKRAGVPTANAVQVSTVSETIKQAEKFSPPYILKADGLAAGKGVFICKTMDELKRSAQLIFEEKILGVAGQTALLEKNLPGYEISFLLLTNGDSYSALPLAQDHKRLLDDNKGPNTGGMGTVAPTASPPELYQKIISRIVEPSVKQIKKENLLFRGVLFIGLMIVENEPFVLEYNVRFGDPETQVILPLLNDDLCDVFSELALGRLQTLESKNLFSFCLVNAAPGYPDSTQKNIPVELPQNQTDAYILHAGTARDSAGHLVSGGGRVLNIVAVASSLESARQLAYDLNAKIKMPGRQFRLDIGRYISSGEPS